MLADLVTEYLAALDAYNAITKSIPITEGTTTLHAWTGTLPTTAAVQAGQRLEHALAALRAAVA